MKKKNIIFISHSEKRPSGGAKIIYRYSEYINNVRNFSSEVVHIKKNKLSKFVNSFKKRLKKNHKYESGWQLKDIKTENNFDYKWFKHGVKVRKNFKFNKHKDFVIIPEIFAHLAQDLLIKKKIEYGIFVQNGYVINSTNNESKLKIAYDNAKFILSYSNNISECIKLKFPGLKTKIIKTSCSIELKKNNLNGKKNLITYMSRKLPFHSQLVLNYLKPHLSKNWKIVNLNGLSEIQTYKFLKKSKIFLSFSSFEGLGLPPAEAALAGNYVVGYTGEGGAEYWSKPLFTKIDSGNIVLFVKTIIKKINIISKNYKFPFKNVLVLKKKFSKENEGKNINKFLKLI